MAADHTPQRATTFLIPCLFLLISTGTAAAPADDPSAAPVQIEVVETRELTPVTWTAGTVLSRDDARLAAEVAGRLEHVAEVGTRLSAGAVAARLDDVLIRETLAEQEAETTRAQARLTFFTTEVQRLRRLASQSNAAQNRLDQAITDRKVAGSELAAAQARVKQARERLVRTVLRAPFAGVVMERYMQAGEWAESGKAVLRLVNTQSLEVQTRIPAASLAFIEPGLELRLGSDNATGKARVRTIVPVGDDRSRLYEVRLTPSNGAWIAGQPVRVAVPAAAAQRVIAVPRDALVLRRDGTSVYRISDNETAQRIPVVTGTAAGAYIEVTGSIQPGDRVVVRGGERLRPGQKVRVIPPGNQP